MLGNNNKPVEKKEVGASEKAFPFARTYSFTVEKAKVNPKLKTLCKASDKLFGGNNAIRNLNEGNAENVRNAIENLNLELAGAFLVGDIIENLLAKVQQYQVLLANEVSLGKDKDEEKVREFKQGLDQATTDLKKQAKEITEFLAKK